MESYGYKAKTNNTQVAIRESPYSDATVLMRVANTNSPIEVGTTPISSDGTTWRECAYGYQKIGYMMDDFITMVDQQRDKYWMLATMRKFGNSTWQRGHEDEGVYGPIYYIQDALNEIADNYFSDEEDLDQLRVTKDGIFGSRTENAVKIAQRFMGCDDDGKVGPHTKARLGCVAYNYTGWPLSGLD